MKQIFSSILAYMFDSTENPEYANAAHIKIVKDTDERYPNNLIIVALDEMKNVDAMFSFDAQLALEPFEVIHDDDCDCELCISICANCTDDEKHFREMKEFFITELQNITFKPRLSFCSCCGTDKKIFYIGIITASNGQPLNFSFCIDCRDELTLKKNAASAALEKIGA